MAVLARWRWPKPAAPWRSTAATPRGLKQTADDIRAASGAKVIAVAGDLDDPAVREALLAACPEPDILVNNNGGPPPAPFSAI